MQLERFPLRRKHFSVKHHPPPSGNIGLFKLRTKPGTKAPSHLQALLADITERQRRISTAREASRTLVKPEDLREAQQEVQEGIDDVTAICKRVKVIPATQSRSSR